MAQTNTIPTGIIPPLQELREAAATLQQIRKQTSTAGHSIALDYIADKLVEFANTIERRVQV